MNDKEYEDALLEINKITGCTKDEAIKVFDLSVMANNI